MLISSVHRSAVLEEALADKYYFKIGTVLVELFRSDEHAGDAVRVKILGVEGSWTEFIPDELIESVTDVSLLRFSAARRAYLALRDRAVLFT